MPQERSWRARGCGAHRLCRGMSARPGSAVSSMTSTRSSALTTPRSCATWPPGSAPARRPQTWRPTCSSRRGGARPACAGGAGRCWRGSTGWRRTWRPTGELRAIGQGLEAAAAEARLEVPAEETEGALRAARPNSRARRRIWPAAAVALAVVAMAAALLLAGPFGSGPAADVQAQALAALGGRGSVLEVVERIRPGPAGGFRPSTRTGWIDPTRGRAAWVQRTAAGIVVDRTLVARGRITRYDPATLTAIVAPSCAALPTGCAPAVDPTA